MISTVHPTTIPDKPVYGPHFNQGVGLKHKIVVTFIDEELVTKKAKEIKTQIKYDPEEIYYSHKDFEILLGVNNGKMLYHRLVETEYQLWLSVMIGGTFQYRRSKVYPKPLVLKVCKKFIDSGTYGQRYHDSYMVLRADHDVLTKKECGV